LSGPFNLGALWQNLPELTREAFRVRSHSPTQEAAQRVASTLSLDGVADQIRCPLFLVAGEQDKLVPVQDVERLAREAKGPVDLLRIEDGNHIANNRPYKWRLRTADWMAMRWAPRRWPVGTDRGCGCGTWQADDRRTWPKRRAVR